MMRDDMLKSPNSLIILLCMCMEGRDVCAEMVMSLPSKSYICI